MFGGRVAVLLTTMVLVGSGLAVTQPAAATAAGGRNLPAQISVGRDVKQLVTVTSRRWDSTRATMKVWSRTGDGWRLAHDPVRVSLGWNGFVRAKQRRQSTGTTPAGRFGFRSVFGTRADPGSKLDYRRVDGNDFWPYEPRDPATYNILQPFKARTTTWREGYAERLAEYGYEYSYSLVLGYNLPRGVRWSERRKQYVARHPADTERGGGIFLHVKKQRYTAGCVSAPIRSVRRLVRWLDPEDNPKIVMGPGKWVRKRF